MKKNLIITVLAIISIVSLIFGYSQKQKADEQTALAKKYFEKIKEESRISKEIADMAEKKIEEMKKEVELAVKKKESKPIRK